MKSQLKPRMENHESNSTEDRSEKIYKEGLQEAIEAILVDDIYKQYGILVAQGKIEFNEEAIKDTSEVYRIVMQYWKPGPKRGLDW